ncbi:VOC family protein [Pseudomonas xantholysinigenes]|uniref:Bleomycin resistance family protein n=1 Tax=Pseudomonas xantholysinigenes TaxID=2745490 RepID=A0A9E6PRG6_9PSED|nr:VOC family protein [Pseudomonas xantholysinigenes]QXI36242.1 bleomycin resistance family protein [Pseudomonas xantholysinigenes]
MLVTPLLRCANLEQTRQYYRDVLGFTVSDSAGSTLTVCLQDSHLLFTEQDLWPPQPIGCTGTFYLAIEGIEAYFQQVRAQAEIAWPLQDMDYGAREFGVLDCNGYYLAFSQRRSDAADAVSAAS